jgi:hypothetical protein
MRQVQIGDIPDGLKLAYWLHCQVSNDGQMSERMKEEGSKQTSSGDDSYGCHEQTGSVHGPSRLPWQPKFKSIEKECA